MIDADIYQIKEVDAYPFDYHECTKRASEELKNNTRPQILDPLESIDEYDTIYLGYPNWWSTMPTIVMTFLESYDLQINISILFVHMKEAVWEEVKVILKNFVQISILHKGLSIHGSHVDGCKTTIRKRIRRKIK